MNAKDQNQMGNGKPPRERATNVSAAPKLTPASRNPWYILATVHGEQTESRMDHDLHTLNRRTWNRWMAASLDDAARELLIEKDGHNPEDLVPLDPEERAEIEALASERFAEAGVTLPEDNSVIDFGYVDFETLFVADAYVFPEHVRFEAATFQDAAELRRRQPRLMLLQDANDLFFAEPTALHHPSPRKRNRLTPECGSFRGARHCQPPVRSTLVTVDSGHQTV